MISKVRQAEPKLPERTINVGNRLEVRYWSERLGVSREALRRAVEQAGPVVADFRRHLNR